MAYTPALSVIKYDPTSTIALECYEDFSEGDLIYVDTAAKWRKAYAAQSHLATHIAVTDGSATPTGEGNDTTKWATGFTRGQVEVSTAWTNYGGLAYLADTAGQYSNKAGATSQFIGTIVSGSGKLVDINIVPTANNNPS